MNTARITSHAPSAYAPAAINTGCPRSVAGCVSGPGEFVRHAAHTQRPPSSLLHVAPTASRALLSRSHALALEVAGDACEDAARSAASQLAARTPVADSGGGSPGRPASARALCAASPRAQGAHARCRGCCRSRLRAHARAACRRAPLPSSTRSPTTAAAASVCCGARRMLCRLMPAVAAAAPSHAPPLARCAVRAIQAAAPHVQVRSPRDPARSCSRPG